MCDVVSDCHDILGTSVLIVVVVAGVIGAIILLIGILMLKRYDLNSMIRELSSNFFKKKSTIIAHIQILNLAYNITTNCSNII